jgi:chemotaxis protein histidine kinase CheA
MKDDHFIRDFVERSQERLGELEADLLDLEVDPSAVIHQLLRHTVSIRAEAEMIGVKHIEDITRYLTKYLEVIRDHPLQPDTELVTLLLKLFDSLEYSLQ